jgi:hypothetical protein
MTVFTEIIFNKLTLTVLMLPMTVFVLLYDLTHSSRVIF